MKSSTSVRPTDLRHSDQQVDVVGADDDHRRREQLVGVGHRLAQLAPVVAVDLGQIGFAPDRRALVHADVVGGGDAIGEEGGDGRRVQPLDMIAFQESIDEQLPVAGDVMGAALVKVEIAQPERVEIGPKRHRVAEIGGIVLRPPDQPAGLDAGKFRRP